MSQKIKIRRGLKADLPVLEAGEFGFCTDTQELFIGTGISNKLINATVTGGNLTVEDSTINGNIKINGQEVVIFDTTNIDQTISEINTSLAEKANKTHSHSIADVTGLEGDLADKASKIQSLQNSDARQSEKISSIESDIVKIEDGIEILQLDMENLKASGGTGGGSVPANIVLFDNWAGGESVTVGDGTTPPVDTTAPVVTVSPNGGSFSASQSVTISTNETATIYYTLDGSSPTESSAVYSGAITLTDTKTLNVFAKDSAGNKSAIKTAIFTKEAVVPPTLNPPTNVKASNISDTGLTLTWLASTSTISGYEIYNGSEYITMVTGLTYNVTGLTKGTDYTFKVRAKDAGNNYSDFATVSAKTIDPANASHVTDGLILYLDALDNSTHALSGVANQPATWKDKSGANNDMTMTPKAGWTIQASAFTAEGFNPTSAGLGVGGSLPYNSFNDYPITWEFVVKLPKDTLNELIRVYDGTDFVRINHSATNVIAFNKNIAGGTLIGYTVPANVYTDHAYMHIVCVITAGSAKLYINGALAQQGASVYNVLDENAPSGLAQYQYLESNMKNSKLKVMRAYNRELSASEVINNHLASVAIMD
ncbi:hypothetical protein CN984_12245 [Bacillus cereus]|uniref:Uncharacterized protein n=1 Tax=Bacillus cereus TaxID=1396 RepID=A0A2A7FNA2_BACCE|nr:chitobiase/beta-hexosaminidase C-terminal domain-containing protein [Bacillus cereus]PEA25814.1 hypothetical protein CON44_17850 [Bacillus cereus]PGO29205.1 hypothetical protein CN984_12245 [Bacillus cereus]